MFEERVIYTLLVGRMLKKLYLSVDLEYMFLICVLFLRFLWL